MLRLQLFELLAKLVGGAAWLSEIAHDLPNASANPGVEIHFEPLTERRAGFRVPQLAEGAYDVDPQQRVRVVEQLFERLPRLSIGA